MAKKRIKKIISPNERMRRKKRKRNNILLVYLFLFLAVIGGCIYMIRLDAFRIKGVKVVGIEGTDKEAVEKKVNETLQGNKYLIIPNNQAFFYSTDELRDRLPEEFPFLINADISLDSNHELLIEIKKREPVAVFCNGECAFIDKAGYVYAPAPSFSPGVFVEYGDGRATSTPIIDTSLLDAEEFGKIQDFIGKLKGIGLITSKVFLEEYGNIIVYISGNGYIRIQLEQPIDQTLANIQTALSEGARTFEYIDVRYGNKIYYKTLNEL